MSDLTTRRWVFLGLAVVVIIAMLIPVSTEVTVSPYTQRMYDYIDSLPQHSVIMVSFDHEASSQPEIRPLSVCLLRHAFSRGLKLVGVSFLSEGSVIGYRMMEQVANEYGREYGVDYAYLGFRPQVQAAILAMGESIAGLYPHDYFGKPLDSISMLSGIDSLANISAVISIADGNFTTHWMEYGKAQFNVPIIAGVTASMVTTYDPYLGSGQLSAMVGGLRGAAEYERLLNLRGAGQRGMLAQSATHLYLILLILIGNVIYFKARRGRR
jgi:hypothetical protein